MRIARAAFVATLMIALIALSRSGGVSHHASAQMSGMGPPSNPTPPVAGFYRGEGIFFIHTEASDARVAEMLTRMMGPKVLVVPSLARIPRALLGTVYAFRNGIRGEGPFGYQEDVFGSAPGDPAYTPLRLVHFVEWRPGAGARVLRAAGQVKAAAAKGEVTIRPSGVVVNMPVLTWPGGRR